MAKIVNIIGVGNMGGGMALHLLARGYTVYVHDVDEATRFEMSVKFASDHSP